MKNDLAKVAWGLTTRLGTGEMVVLFFLILFRDVTISRIPIKEVDMNSLLKTLIVLVILLGMVMYLKSYNERSPDVPSADRPSNQVTAAEREDASMAIKTFTDTKGNYRISVPPGWKLDDKTASNHMIRADIVKTKEFGLQIRAYFNERNTLEDYTERFVAQFMDEMSKHWRGDIREEERQCYSGATRDKCVSSIVFNRADGKDWFFREYLFKKDDIVIVLQCGCKLEDRLTGENELDIIAETFAFLN